MLGDYESRRRAMIYSLTSGNQCWNFRTINGDYEPSRNRVVVPERKGILDCLYRVLGINSSDGINSSESIPGLLKSLKIPSLIHGDGEASFF